MKTNSKTAIPAPALAIAAAFLAGPSFAYPEPVTPVMARYAAQDVPLGRAMPGLTVTRPDAPLAMVEAPIHDVKPLRRTAPNAVGQEMPPGSGSDTN